MKQDAVDSRLIEQISSVSFEFEQQEARGTISLARGAYGLLFAVRAPDGTQYSGALDLFHFSKDGDGSNHFQVVLDQPEFSSTFVVRMMSDGTIDTLEQRT